jgi:hypothetical protein
MTQVVVGQNEAIESALRRFKRQVAKAGIYADIKKLNKGFWLSFILIGFWGLGNRLGSRGVGIKQLMAVSCQSAYLYWEINSARLLKTQPFDHNLGDFVGWRGDFPRLVFDRQINLFVWTSQI